MPASRALEPGRGLCMSASRCPDGGGTKQQQTEMLKPVDVHVPTDGQFPSACPPSPGRMNGHAPSSQSTALPRAISRPSAHARTSGEQTSGACFSNEWVWWAAAACLWVRGGPGGTWRIRGAGRGLPRVLDTVDADGAWGDRWLFWEVVVQAEAHSWISRAVRTSDGRHTSPQTSRRTPQRYSGDDRPGDGLAIT